MTVQFRLTIRFIAVLLMAGVVLSILTARNIGGALIDEVQDRVALDLNSARTVYDSQASNLALFLAASARDPRFIARPTAPPMAESELAALRELAEMDRLCWIDLSGQVKACAGADWLRAYNLLSNAVVRKAISEKSPTTGTVLVRAVPEATSITLASATAPATTAPGVPDHQLMAVAAAVPIRDPAGVMTGLLYGAKILNNRSEIVDTIRDQVFRKQAWHGRNVGTATIFQGDLRISTNVQTRQGQPALGTHMSPDVAQAVLERGERYAREAHVVDDWYITAYEPIRDPDGLIVGALYVGLLRAPYIELRNTIIGGFVAAVTGTTVVILFLLVLTTRQVLRPIERVVAMASRVTAGDLSARVGIRPSGEMGRLCEAVDHMADAVALRERQLHQATRRQISQSEKLASIGRLAAGIAHEVNNPLTGVLTFTHLLRQKSNLDDQDCADLDLVIRETTRVRDIVRGLLDFARESPSKIQRLDVNGVLTQATRLLRGQKEFREIIIDEKLAMQLPMVLGDQNQLQQVFLNLALNACEAMTGGGRLIITTKRDDSNIVVQFADTGHGIKPEDLDRIFEPFFTTKPVGKGTGLGLSVSYGIIQQHGGGLEVESDPGQGTTFSVVLPIERPAETSRIDPAAQEHDQATKQP